MKSFYILLISAVLCCHTYAMAEDVIYQAPEYKAMLEGKKAKKAAKIIDKGEKLVPPEAQTIISNDNKPRVQDNVTINYKDRNNNGYNESPDHQTISSESLRKDAQIKTDCENSADTCLTAYIYEDKITLEAYNKSPAAYTLIMKYFLNNMRAENDSDKRNIILKPGEKKIIENLYVIDKSYSYGYDYSYQPYFGVVDAIHDDNYVYDLPFDLNEKFILLQGVGGNFSHNTEENYYAYDFKMPVKTPVLAARDGIVVKVVDNYIKGGVDPTLKKKSNYVYIQHSDGTIADYSHLSHKGALVHVGDYVQKNQKIALSGNTGYTNTAHLHFRIFKVIRNGKFKSVAIKMKTKQGVLPRLKAGDFYEK